MFYKINELHFTGGDTALWKINSSTGERTFESSKKNLNLAIEANHNSDNFSI